MALFFLRQIDCRTGACVTRGTGGSGTRRRSGAAHADAGFPGRRAGGDVAAEERLDGRDIFLRSRRGPGRAAHSAADCSTRLQTAGRGKRGSESGGDGCLCGTVRCQRGLQGPSIVIRGAVGVHRSTEGEEN